MRATATLRASSAAGALLLLVGYVGAYYLLVDSAWLLPGNTGPPVAARYGYGGLFAEYFFRPMEAVDRRLRPEWWAGFPATPPWQAR